MLKAPHFENYRNGDFVQYCNNVLELMDAARATNLNVAPQRTTLNDTMTQFNDVWQPARGSELTPNIAALDADRDSVYTGLKMTVDAWATNHYLDDHREAAYIVSDNIKGHGERVHRMRYQQQTATLNAIINDLENQYAPQITLLGLADWVDTLKNLNEDFNDAYLGRTQALSLEQEGIVAQMREQATADFRALRQAFDFRMGSAQLDNVANLADFVAMENEWNQLTDQYNEAVERYSCEDGEPEPENPAALEQPEA